MTMKLMVSAFVLFMTTRAMAFDITYRYELVVGRDREVCRHMLGIYRKEFRRPWADRAASLGNRDEELWETQYARFPKIAEFDAIRWKAHPYQTSLRRTALFAEFDLDNDGANELVVHLGFFTGSPGSRDHFWIFPLASVDITEIRTHADFVARIADKRITVLDHPVHQRPFIYKSRTYLHAYDYTPAAHPGSNPSEPFAPPEFITISEYRGPLVNAPEAKLERRGGVMNVVCKIKMIQQPIQ